MCSPEQGIPVVEARCHPGHVDLSLGAVITDAQNTPGFCQGREKRVRAHAHSISYSTITRTSAVIAVPFL